MQDLCNSNFFDTKASGKRCKMGLSATGQRAGWRVPKWAIFGLGKNEGFRAILYIKVCFLVLSDEDNKGLFSFIDLWLLYITKKVFKRIHIKKVIGYIYLRSNTSTLIGLYNI